MASNKNRPLFEYRQLQRNSYQTERQRNAYQTSHSGLRNFIKSFVESSSTPAKPQTHRSGMNKHRRKLCTNTSAKMVPRERNTLSKMLPRGRNTSAKMVPRGRNISSKMVPSGMNKQRRKLFTNASSKMVPRGRNSPRLRSSRVGYSVNIATDFEILNVPDENNLNASETHEVNSSLFDGHSILHTTKKKPNGFKIEPRNTTEPPRIESSRISSLPRRLSTILAVVTLLQSGVAVHAFEGEFDTFVLYKQSLYCIRIILYTILISRNVWTNKTYWLCSRERHAELQSPCQIQVFFCPI